MQQVPQCLFAGRTHISTLAKASPQVFGHELRYGLPWISLSLYQCRPYWLLLLMDRVWMLSVLAIPYLY